MLPLIMLLCGGNVMEVDVARSGRGDGTVALVIREGREEAARATVPCAGTYRAATDIKPLRTCFPTFSLEENGCEELPHFVVRTYKEIE